MKIQVANMPNVDQLDSDVMSFNPPGTPKMALVEQIEPFWDNRNSGNTQCLLPMPNVSGNHTDGAFSL